MPFGGVTALPAARVLSFGGAGFSLWVPASQGQKPTGWACATETRGLFAAPGHRLRNRTYQL